MFRDALNAPARTPDAIQTLFFGAFLSLLVLSLPVVLLLGAVSPLLVVFAVPALVAALLLRGYYVRTMRVGLDGRDAAPSFVRWSGLLRDGARSYAIAFVYLFPVVALWFLVVIVAVGTQFGSGEPGVGASALALSATLATVLSGLYFPVFAYLYPAALVSYAATERLGAAFSPRTVGSVLLDKEYATGWLLSSGLLVVVAVVGVPLSLFLVGVVVVFYLQTAANVVYGRAAQTALADELAGDDGRSEPEAIHRGPEAAAAVQVGRSVVCTDGDPEAADRSPEDAETRVDESVRRDGTTPVETNRTDERETVEGSETDEANRRDQPDRT
ncbi:hypothetical protein AUR64_19000 [Haloprofundus marisrubri]|uniref:DUF4013 domain-containing protein n=1 Tax=Haloprofundus marisrubri TaxID=1514971 RepID=A0A0W1R4G9_9EURY|nr:DUF4013 domain-containing protein [Haloprofundus marisrubri]KTG08325.1 hypothetical protein AUR64_19000 [Haloprofundus marisrubri]